MDIVLKSLKVLGCVVAVVRMGGIDLNEWRTVDTTTSSRFREFSDQDIDPSDQVAKTNQAFLLAEEESP